MAFNMDETDRSFRNLTLSYRGAERQAPNTLQLALRFSKVMELRQDAGRHFPTMTVDERLKDCVEAAVASKLSTWKLQHLGIWTDIVEPPSAPLQVHSAAELMDIEEESQAAKFREIRAKLAQDVAGMTQYISGMEENQRRLCENYMEKMCRMTLVTAEQPVDTKLEALYRQAAASSKALKLEDKLNNHKVELRSFTLNLNVDDLHKNRELPSAYVCYLGVLDSTLPLRGTAHRVVRGGGAEPESTGTFGAVVIHPTAYDGCVELACNQLGHCVSGSTNVETYYKSAKEAWKKGTAPMNSLTPRYKKDAATEDMPKQAELPTLKICQIGEGNKLILPRDVRSQFLQDPVWGQEWREIVTNFDKQWNTPVLENASPSSNQSPSPSPNAGLIPKKEEHLEGEFDWAAVFPGEPETMDALKAKYSEHTDMTGSTSYNFILVPGPKLFVVATDALHLKAADSAIICHGAGVWLLGEKAEKYQTDHPGRGVVCSWTDDLGLVVWRLRKYPTEKCIAAAKPLWHLSGDLKLVKDAVKRIA
eukprot:s114_g18.t1